MKAGRELLDAIRGEGCLGKAALDEPVFILRGQDVLAPNLIRLWAQQLIERADLPERGVDDKYTHKAAEALEIADAMDEWQQYHSKLPD